MKVLLMLGCLRKGNTYKVTKQIEERMKEMGDVEFEHIFLKDANLELCRGCFTCITKGEDLCPIKDDRTKIEEQMRDLDGVIFASPGYVFNVTWLMNNFIDLFAYICHRPRLFNQSALLVSTSSPWSTESALKSLSFLVIAGGFHIVHKLGVFIPVFPTAPEFKKQIDNDIDVAARKFYEAIKTKKRPSPRFGDLMQFRGMRSNAILAKEYFPADYEYYNLSLTQ